MWPREEARQLIHQSHEKRTIAARLAALDTQSLIASTAVCYVVLTVLGIAVSDFQLSLLPSLSPTDTGVAQQALWLAYTTFVGVTLPLILLTLQMSMDRGRQTRSAAAVLQRSTPLMILLIFALGGIVKLGMDALWLNSDAILVVDAVFVALPTVTLVGWMYMTAVSTLRSRSTLRDRILSDLSQALKEAATTSLQSQVHDGLVRQTAAEHRIQVAAYWASFPPSNRQLPEIRVPNEGVIVDINPAALGELLETFENRSEASEISEDAAPIESLSTSTDPLAIVTAHLGDSVQPGSTIAVLNGELLSEAAVDAVASAIRLWIRIDTPPTGSDSEMSHEIGGLRDYVSDAIVREQTYQFSEGMETYRRLAEGLVEATASAKESLLTSEALPADWEMRPTHHLRWLSDDVRVFARQGKAMAGTSVTQDLMRFGRWVADLGTTHDDQLYARAGVDMLIAIWNETGTAP